MNKKSLYSRNDLEQLINEIALKFEDAGLYFGHGTDNAWDEAVTLVFHVLKLPFDREVESVLIESSQLAQIESFVLERIKTRKPLAYLTHEAYFAGLSFYVDERVIVPRSPFAELLENQFVPWCEPSKVHRILDLCTGSGCMAIAAAHYFPNAKVDAVELSKEAFDVANINVKRFNLEDRVNVIQSDLFNSIPQGTTYDLIISNPPYVSASEMETLPREYHQEPNMALEAKEEGLDIALRILKEARKFLTQEGVLVVEVGNSEEALLRRLPRLAFTWLEFERGGSGVFLLNAKDLDSFCEG